MSSQVVNSPVCAELLLSRYIFRVSPLDKLAVTSKRDNGDDEDNDGDDDGNMVIIHDGKGYSVERPMRWRYPEQ